MVGDNGIKLSGGQRQRLAIARSIIKRPAILILDEATSSIDVRGERIVQEALDRVSKNRTTITIAHRLSTIKKADNIIVLKNGAAVEQGTHDSLLSNANGVYHDLVHAQHLEMAETQASAPEDDIPELNRTISSKSKEGRTDDDTEAGAQIGEPKDKAKGLFNTLGLFLYEQRAHYVLYVLVLLAAMGGGGECLDVPGPSLLFKTLEFLVRLIASKPPMQFKVSFFRKSSQSSNSLARSLLTAVTSGL
jgi:ABC-type glutathione transport system ATPase component